MRVRVERESGILGTASKFQLMVDGEKAQKIKNNETLEIKLPREGAEIKVSQYDAKTNEITVNPGDHLLIKGTTYGLYSRIIIMLAIFVVILSSNLFVQGAALILGIGLSAMTFLGSKPNYRLEKVNATQ
jgi:hypothetical protein